MPWSRLSHAFITNTRLSLGCHLIAAVYEKHEYANWGFDGYVTNIFSYNNYNLSPARVGLFQCCMLRQCHSIQPRLISFLLFFWPKSRVRKLPKNYAGQRCGDCIIFNSCFLAPSERSSPATEEREQLSNRRLELRNFWLDLFTSIFFSLDAKQTSLMFAILIWFAFVAVHVLLASIFTLAFAFLDARSFFYLFL